MFKKTVLPLAALTLCTVFLLIACAGTLSNVYRESRIARTGSLAPAQSYEDILTALLDSQTQIYDSNNFSTGASVMDNAVEAEAPQMSDIPAEPEIASSEQKGFTETNVQVEGIDEADIVKTDGTFLYALFNSELRRYLADGADTVLLDTYDLTAGQSSDGWREVHEMYLLDDTVALICTDCDWSKDYGQQQASVLLLDVSDPVQIRKKDCLGQDGWYTDSRMENGILYLVSDYSCWYWCDGDTPRTYVPYLYADTMPEGEPICVENIFLPSPVEDCSYTVVSAIDAANADRLSNITVMERIETVYMDHESLYLASSHYDEWEDESYTEKQYTVTEHHSAQSTTLTAIDLNSGKLSLRATGVVPGRLLNQFSLDAKDGYLRLAVTERGNDWKIYWDKDYDFTNYVWQEGMPESNSVYVLDNSLQTVGSLTGLGIDERIYSARFDGDMLYLVTFRETDPLFAVDLSNPTAPVLKGSLELPGFSSYLHVYGDGLVFGLGQNVSEETGWREGLKLAMYDSRDPQKLTELDCFLLSEDSWSAALSDHKAILADPQRNLVGFPGDQGYYLFAWENSEWMQLACLDQLSDRWQMRGLVIGDHFYLAASDGLCVYSLDGFTQEAEIR